MAYKRLTDEEREEIIKRHNQNPFLDTIVRNIKQFSENDLLLAIDLAYAACGEDAPVSEYNNVLVCELNNIKNTPISKNRFEECVNKWEKLKGLEKREWREKAKHYNITGFNMFVSECQLK